MVRENRTGSTGNKKGGDRTSALFARFGGAGGVKIACVGIFFGLVWLGLWGRAYYVQMVEGPHLAGLAQRQHVGEERTAGERGQIFDRTGRLLAKSVECFSVYVRPHEIKDKAGTVAFLADTLRRDRREVEKAVAFKGSFRWVARQIGDHEAARIREANLPGVYAATEYARRYPSKHLAGQLIGFTGVDGDGLEGLEKYFDPWLAGGHFRFPVQRDAGGKVLYLDYDARGEDTRGKDVRLTLDSHIQFVTEDVLARAVEQYGARWGAGLVVDVAHGDILAWAQYPWFNPNAYKEYRPEGWRNRIAMDILEPGSTIKPFLVGAALQEGVVDKDSLFYCENGRWSLGGVKIKDSHRHKWLPVNKILRYSSNIGVSKIALELGAEKYHAYLSLLGFGMKTGLSLPGEGRGILRPPRSWRQVDLAAGAFGQGVGSTVLQLAQAYVALANDGVFKPLRLVLEPEQPRGPEERVFDRRVADQVREMMREVVEEDGTGTEARIPGLSVGGKTGTAQKASAAGGYGEEYVSSFVGLIPAEKPKYVVLIVVDEPKTEHYGSIVAAPAFKEVAMKSLAYLGELPDVKTGALAEGGDGHDGQGDGFFQVDSRRAESARAGIPDDGTVPDVIGLPLRRAAEIFARQGIVPVVKGEGMVVSRQNPAPGAQWGGERGRQCVLWLAYDT